MQEQRDISQIRMQRIASEEIDYLSSPPEYQILTYPADYTLEVLISKLHANEIETPPFQRGYVWKPAKAERLIESFLLNLPVPPVYLYTEQETKKLLVIDGQQRLKSILYFFDGFFGEAKRGKRNIFRLDSLHEKSKWYQKGFEDLSDAEKRDFKSKVLRAFIVEQVSPKDDTSVYHVFERLNTGGMLLNNQEIRNSLYHGVFNDLLKDLNKLDDWRKILGKKTPDQRQKDVELVLRFLAMHFDLKNYIKPMKDFLSAFMAKHRKLSSQRSAEFREVFVSTCSSVKSALGERPFSRGAGLNAPIFDSVYVAFAANLSRLPKNVKERFTKLLKDKDYQNATRNATTDESVVKQRIRIARSYLIA
jgi:uncharacterized protein with ParB-like and HNH nuclease domain